MSVFPVPDLQGGWMAQKLHPSALVDWKSWTHHTFAPTTEVCRFRRHGSRLVISDSGNLDSKNIKGHQLQCDDQFNGHMD